MISNVNISRLRIQEMRHLTPPVWTDKYEQFGFERNPLCLCISEEKHRKLYVCAWISELPPNADAIEKIIEQAKTDCDFALVLLSHAAKTIYLAKCCGHVSNGAQTLVDTILNQMIARGSEFVGLYEMLCGRKDFKLPYFQIGEGTSNDEYFILSFSITLYLILVTHSSDGSSNRRLSLLAQCLINPLNTLLPSCITNIQLEIDIIPDERCPFSCTCGFRFFEFVQSTKQICPICRREQSEDIRYRNEQMKKCFAPSKSHKKYPDGLSNLLHPFSSELLSFMIKSCLFGSVALGNSTMDIVGETLRLPSASSEDVWTMITTHWTNMLKALSVDSISLWLILEMILHRSLKIINEPHDSTNSTWEGKFSSHVLKLLNRRSENVGDMLRRHDFLHSLPDRSTEQTIFEVDETPDNDNERICRPLFRLKNRPSEENVVFELWEQQSKYPFVSLVLRNKRLLQFPIHIYNIIRWHVATVTNASVLLKQDCLEMTVTDFIYKKGDLLNKDALKTRFDAVKETWDFLKNNINFIDSTIKMERIHMNSKMSECLIHCEETVVFKLLHSLVCMQNEFLDKTLRIAKHCDALSFLLREKQVAALPSIEISDVTQADLLQMVTDFEVTLSIFSQSVLEYGAGKKVEYDFRSIEKTLAMKIVSGKAFINFTPSLPKVIFKDVLHLNYASLLSDLKQKISQKSLPPEIKDDLFRKMQEDPKNSTVLLMHLGVVMSLLKKTSGKPEQLLEDYIKSKHNILTRDFPEHLLPSRHSLQLRHVVALSEILEELCSEFVIYGLDDDYKELLNEESRNEMKQLASKVQFSKVMLKALKRFVYRCLTTKTAAPLSPLRQYLVEESFWPDGCLRKNVVFAVDGKTTSLELLIPDFVMVSHIHDVINILQSELQRHEEKSRRIEKMIETTRHSTVVKSKSKKHKSAIVSKYVNI